MTLAPARFASWTAARPAPAVAPGDPARILVSSGSESEPKVVAYSHDAFALGATLIVRRRFDPAAALRVIREDRPTHVFGVPTMLSRLAERHHTGRPDGLRALVSSGAPLPPRVESRVRARFRTPVIVVYGSTDGVNCHNAVDGRPDPAVATIVVTDEDGRPLPPGTPGEIRPGAR